MKRFVREYAWLIPCAAALAAALSCLSVPFVGGFHDDGIYITTAKALAEGRGYVIESLPASLPQTKYPVLFPAALSVAWRFNPTFPNNVPLLRLVPLLAAIAWAAALWWLIGRLWQQRRDAGWIIAVTVTAPMAFFLSITPLSETLFSFLSVCALAALWRAQESPRGAELRWAIAAGALCAAAYQTRTIGITLLPCAVVAFWPRRRVAAASAFAVSFAVLCLPWWIWQSMHQPPGDAVLAYYTHANYSGWNAITGAGGEALGRVILNNSIMAAAAAVPFWMLPTNPATLLLAAALAVAALIGIFRQIVEGPTRLAAVWILSVCGVALLWPWPPQRFLVPLLPFLLLAVRDGVRSRHEHKLKLIGSAVVVLTIGWGLVHCIDLARRSRAAGVVCSPTGCPELRWQDYDAAFDWLRTEVGPGAVIAGTSDPNYWLYSGRKAIRAFAVDPVRLFYTEDAPSGALGDSTALANLLTEANVDYLVFEDVSTSRETEPLRRQIREVQRLHPALLSTVFEQADGRLEILRVNAPANP